ncbi:hypothetical protein BZG36_00170 [Bifiguratus adelaidae]|uniref:BHLH domain-containing protein n=1 Tax=Bifiguratus adelaidae TaxID=1938954 RepID=A0A261Y8L2_9FUNG|nr:hypothetical protein BZG36_00170 [Bifiguratus adelaidae]
MDIKSIVSQQEDTEGSVGDQEPEPTWWSESGPSTPEATEQYSQYPNLTETTPQRRVKGRRRTLTTPLPSPAHMVEQIPHKHIMADVGQTSATPSFAPPLAPSLAPPYPAPSSSHPSTKAPDSTRRQAHILSEQKRRENINAGFEDLRKAVPPCANTTDSKALILRKGEYNVCFAVN